MPPRPEKKIILILGGHGFIGSHVARQLFVNYRAQYRIRIVDTAPRSLLTDEICDEFIQGNLCDFRTCHRVVLGVHTVLHFAATMGGMGMIHEKNDFTIYEENHTMTINILKAAVGVGVKRLLFASSACVYPNHLQHIHNPGSGNDVSLRESDVWSNPPPRPQGLYGQEKLGSELLAQCMSDKLDIRIARFHNVYGPGGAWSNGREKAPAAMLRKAYAQKYLSELNQQNSPFEVWGDGRQRRSFLYIDDAVDAVIKLLESNYRAPLNIGSDSSVSVDELAKVALECARVSGIDFSYNLDRPTGVGARNSNNELVESTLRWRPATSLRDGMRKTGDWIQQEMNTRISSCRDPDEKKDMLLKFTQSTVVDLGSENVITFAILLPITSRGGDSPDDCLVGLGRFADSLLETTRHDARNLGTTRYQFRIYLAIDCGDTYLLEGSTGLDKPTFVLHKAGILDTHTLLSDALPGRICDLWRLCARRAYDDGCDYFVLMGDDVILPDEGWMRAVHAEFARMSSSMGVPFGFGCVALTDTSFPGMPTFPVVHRTHMDIFEKEVVPKAFVNQDGDPFLFQLYRRWGCSSMIEKRILNCVGGPGAARYKKEHAKDWMFKPLARALETARAWLRSRGSDVEEKLVVDVVIPSYRVDLKYLSTILELKCSKSCSFMFIIIIDDPNTPHAGELERRYGGRVDVRIRRNDMNLGASESRNRGMHESAADWIHFLDDDIVPQRDLLLNVEKAIREHPDAAGFVGTTIFPDSETVYTTAVRLAGVAFFWDIAKNPFFADDVPWGVTANLVVRRNIDFNDNILFDTSFPKTGGGEDIDFCRKKRDSSIRHLNGRGFVAAPNVEVTHPWWGGGARSYWRFYRWSYGDGALVKTYPELTYYGVPNSAELLHAWWTGIGVTAMLVDRASSIWFLKAVLTTIVVNVLHDFYRHLWKHPERCKILPSSTRGVAWLAAILESSFIRMSSEVGRLHGMLARGDFLSIGKRFDWFAGRLPSAPSEERMNDAERLLLLGLFMILL